LTCNNSATKALKSGFESSPSERANLQFERHHPVGCPIAQGPQHVMLGNGNDQSWMVFSEAGADLIFDATGYFRTYADARQLKRCHSH
jgi:hypothetical protein